MIQNATVVGVQRAGGGGEDEHKRGIEMTKIKVEIHLLYLIVRRLQVRRDNRRGASEEMSSDAPSVSVFI